MDDAKRLPKGLTSLTLRTLCLWIDAHPTDEFSTDDLAAAVNISRVSCRKYLIWLAQINILFTSIHYGATGRRYIATVFRQNAAFCLSGSASELIAVVQQVKSKITL